jgi:heme/copper-type cytochrome/quinol oxidase subunit 4
MNQLAIANLNITNWEVIIVIFLIVGGFLLGLILGRNKMFLMLLGSYIASALLSVVPIKKMFPDFFGKEENFVVLIILYLVLIGIVYFIFSKSGKKTRRKGFWFVFQTFFYALFLVGIVLSMVFSFLPKDLISEFSSVTLNIFNTSLARVLWLVIPLIFIGIFRRKD